MTAKELEYRGRKLIARQYANGWQIEIRPLLSAVTCCPSGVAARWRTSTAVPTALPDPHLRRISR
jgi:hypothetical protein